MDRGAGRKVAGISTAWATKNGLEDPEGFLGVLERLGLRGLELDFRVTRRFLEGLRPHLRAQEAVVLSLHNYCPVPEVLPEGKASGDAFNLASPDWEERREAIRWTMRTLEVASDLEAEAVVLHLGYIPDLSDRLHDLYRKGKLTRELLQGYLKERREKAQRPFDALLKALEPILKRAEALGVRVGVENRYYPNEFPLPEEAERIFMEFEGAPIGYWHDVGHAHAMEKLGIIGQRELLERFRDSLLGVHIHDAQGLKDHRPPGQGEVDFEALRELLPEGAIRILEVHPPAEEEEILEGLAFLREKGLL